MIALQMQALRPRIKDLPFLRSLALQQDPYQTLDTQYLFIDSLELESPL